MAQGMQAGAPLTAPLIELRGITKHYGGGDSGQPAVTVLHGIDLEIRCLLYTSPSPRDRQKSRMPSSA